MQIFLIRRHGVNLIGKYTGFHLRRHVVHECLCELAVRHPMYARQVIDEARLRGLPEDGAILDHLPTELEDDDEAEAAEAAAEAAVADDQQQPEHSAGAGVGFSYAGWSDRLCPLVVGE